MLNINEIEDALREATHKAYEESMTISEAFIATNCDDKALQLADTIATNKHLALQDALDVVTKISRYSDETAKQIVDRIIKEITFKVEFVAKKMSEPDEALAS